MFRIKGKSVSNRVVASRTGTRSRRLPSIVLRNGAVIKIHPNRHVFVSSEDVKANLPRLVAIADMITVSHGVYPFETVSLEDLCEDIVEATDLMSEPEPEVIIEPEPEVIIEPEPSKPPVKKRRKRRTKAQIAADNAKARG